MYIYLYDALMRKFYFCAHSYSKKKISNTPTAALKIITVTNFSIAKIKLHITFTYIFITFLLLSSRGYTLFIRVLDTSDTNKLFSIL